MGCTVHLPKKIIAGTTLTIPCENGITCYLRGPSSIDLTSENYKLTADASVTSKWPPGRYVFALRRKEGDIISELSKGFLDVEADISSISDGTDVRSSTRRTYEAICAVIEKRASIDQQEYKINNRELKRTPIVDLLKLRHDYALFVRREEGKSNFREIKVIF